MNAIALHDPESINRRFIERARIGPLLTILCAAVVLFAMYNVYHHWLRLTEQEKLWFFLLTYGLFDFGALILARRVFREAFLGTLTVAQVLRLAVLIGAATALVTISVLAYAHFPGGPYKFRIEWLPEIALRAIAITIILFGWLQTRLGAWISPLGAACVAAALLALLESYEHRSWVVAVAAAGAYALPFVRWKTGSLGVCVLAWIFSDFLSVAVMAKP
jgi:hypothetical protein